MRYQNIVDEEWDYLIVLDACRFDIFEDMFEEFFSGVIEKRKSRGSSTLDWLVNSFPGEYDISYFSANPYINSKGVPLDKSEWGVSCEYSWNPKEHFSEIIDVWEFGWEEELGTVHPRELNEALLSRRNGKKYILLHYMQPHAPYLSDGDGMKLKRIKEGFEKLSSGEGDGKSSGLGRWIRSKLVSYLEKMGTATKLGMLLDLEPDTILNEVRKNGTERTLRKYYRENLRSVLEYVSRLIDDLEGKIIVTSDHGEAFGEQGIWEHHVETPIPPLIEVPWVEIEKN